MLSTIALSFVVGCSDECFHHGLSILHPYEHHRLSAIRQCLLAVATNRFRVQVWLALDCDDLCPDFKRDDTLWWVFLRRSNFIFPSCYDNKSWGSVLWWFWNGETL